MFLMLKLHLYSDDEAEARPAFIVGLAKSIN